MLPLAGLRLTQPLNTPHPNRDTESPRIWLRLIWATGHLGMCSSSPRGRLGLGEGCHLGLQIIALLFVQTTVHHVHDVIDCDRRLRDVGGQDNLAYPNWRLLKYGLLVHHGDVGVHWWVARTCQLWALLLLPVMSAQGKDFDPILMKLRPRSRLCLGKVEKPAKVGQPGRNPGTLSPNWLRVPKPEGRTGVQGPSRLTCTHALTWQDEVLALVHAQGLLEALLHSFDLLPTRQEAEDPTCKGALQA